MTSTDLPLAEEIAEQVHPAHPEDPKVFAERLRLFGQGCLILELTGQPVGYAIAHPWVLDRPPKLNTLLQHLPGEPDTLFIHDLALLSGARGRGHAAEAVRLMVRKAVLSRLPTLSLVAVGTSPAFWRCQGFVPLPDEAIQNSLGSYGLGARYMVRRL